MFMTDPVADMITRIRNAFLAKKAEVAVPFSRLKLSVAEILVKEGYLMGIEKLSGAAVMRSPRTSRRAAKRDRVDLLLLTLKYDAMGRPAARHLERVSKPSRRVYVSKDEIPTVLSGLGIAILSTSRGVMTNRQARVMKVGGEILCKVY